MMCEIARKNVKYMNDIMYKTKVHGLLDYYERDCGKVHNAMDFQLGRYSCGIEAVVRALEMEISPESIIGKYDEILHVDWLIELYKRTQCEELKSYLYTIPFMEKGLTSENMPKVEIEFQYVIMIGSYYQNHPNYVEFKDKKEDLDYDEKPTSFVLKNVNEPKFDLTFLDTTIKTDINEFFVIKDFVIDNKIKSGSKLKQFHLELQQNANLKKS